MQKNEVGLILRFSSILRRVKMLTFTSVLMLNMLESLHSYLGNFVQLTDADIQMINKIFVYTKINKNELIVENGKVCNRLLFVNNGYVRFFHFDDNGTEITNDFYFAPTFVTIYTSFLTGLPTNVNVQAMCKMEALELSKNDLNELYEKYPKFERVGRLIAESVAIRSHEHLFMLLNQPAGVRYRKLLENYPQYINTIPLQYIASYLGITQETLSRIRKSKA